jgi:hypothetical protein
MICFCKSHTDPHGRKWTILVLTSCALWPITTIHNHHNIVCISARLRYAIHKPMMEIARKRGKSRSGGLKVSFGV